MQPSAAPNTVIRDAVAARALFADLAGEHVEVAEAVHLDPNWMVCGRSRFMGTPGSVAISIRRLVRDALGVEAAHVLLAHNHPSGDARASADDIRFTRRLAQTLTAMEMPLVDHLIVTRHAILSMREQGLL